MGREGGETALGALLHFGVATVAAVAVFITVFPVVVPGLLLGATTCNRADDGESRKEKS